jgi:phosphate transport system substrate-binding protein
LLTNKENIIVKKLITFIVTALTATITYAADITGAGATFPYPIYAKWAEAYKKESGVGLNYQSIGSSGGVRQINAGTVTFGATDAPVKGEELDKAGQIQFPAIIGGTVPIVNLDGFKPGELRITGSVLAEVFMGTITKWNDPKLVSLNPGKRLPDQSITVVHRADGSGTTFNWTDYLTVVSPDWAQRVGRGAAVKWPAASSVGGKGNEGVAANVTRIKGSIGYVEYAYVKKNNLVFMQLQNRSGRWVSPDDITFAAAADGADWFSVPGMGLSIVNQSNPNAWPVSSASFIIMYKNPKDKEQSADVIKFFDWAFKNGKNLALELDYVPLPDTLTNQIRQRVWTQINNK